MGKILEIAEIYKNHFSKIDVNVLKKLLEQYQWEQINGLDLHTTKICALKQVIDDKAIYNLRKQ